MISAVAKVWHLPLISQRHSYQIQGSAATVSYSPTPSARLRWRRRRPDFGGLGDSDDLGVGFQVLAEGAAEDAHAGAVDDADVGESGEEGAVDKLFDLGGGFINVAADDVEFGGGRGVFVAEADVDAFAAGGV